jgi:hypothetical protein
MPSLNDPCWRDASGVAALELPFRVDMPDGSTRTDHQVLLHVADEGQEVCGLGRLVLRQVDLNVIHQGLNVLV